ncbi:MULTISPECIES: hypothetical protein [unclassified Streptomyces]|uniref:hypothetical protein n=1 Tax=unclassified Streptomyces TaxID=2593676 RepID=UPI000DADD613|nr:MULTISPECIES: hypothetical protein [unclassified Streptomyces]PZT76041.1 hypothetical protein DNK56_21950 [Streptomyces sp. AC1-42W]PZT80008.1 hypothetical protein DNK55_10735 [Streptomyces sp. AC1-42T]
MDLLDWHRGRLSSRRLAVLVKHMPQDSAVARELDGEDSQWTVTDHLLAAAVDHLAAANWMFASVNTDEDADPPEAPVPVPRPGDERPTDTDGTTAEAPETVVPEGPSRAELMRFFV